jgi:hypothetical protein
VDSRPTIVSRSRSAALTRGPGAAEGPGIADVTNWAADIRIQQNDSDVSGQHRPPGARVTHGVPVLTAADHPLAGHPRLQLTHLNGFTLVMFPRSMAPGMYDDVLGTCKAAGYRPARIEPGVRMVDGLLAADTAVTFNTSHAFSTAGRGGVYRGLTWTPLEGEPLRWRTSVVCHRLDRNPLTRTAVQVIARALQQHDRWQRA